MGGENTGQASGGQTPWHEGSDARPGRGGITDPQERDVGVSRSALPSNLVVVHKLRKLVERGRHGFEWPRLVERVKSVAWSLWVLKLLGSLVLLAAVLLVGAQLLDQRPDDAYSVFRSNRGGDGPPEPVELRPRFEEQRPGFDSPVHLRFVLESFDPNEGIIRGRASGEIDVAAFERDHPFQELPTSTTLSMISLYQTQSVEVALAPRSAGFSVSPPAVEIAFETWGEQRAFPSDAYGSNYFFIITGALGSPSISVISSQNFSQYHVLLSANSRYLNLLIERYDSQVCWVYLIALTPLLLFIALHVVSKGRLQRQGGTFAIEVVVGLLALLPLRQVLVPSSLVMITNIDILLGMQLAIFVVWVAFEVVRSKYDEVPIRLATVGNGSLTSADLRRTTSSFRTEASGADLIETPTAASQPRAGNPGSDCGPR